ncbi:hypothetical protein ROE7235_03851 [Roseibaca ekhonensis]|jgi:hypothetical protein|uniref:Uncharacterized protein n=1 Tax=Roseinatronobacter ekhonensis TaxID=254356 RepID=A0A3B0MWC1_9RHOB|nr:hypothetical protein [Roseibaca ekhonensis]SUZ34069.1 hypothetical protein ROE7235_03851 [Roseibaca ekhonensis]
MKELSFKLDEYQLGALFQPFRKKPNIVLFWMEAIKLISSYVPPSSEDSAGELLVQYGKMRRIIVYSKSKAFSTAFPFSISDVDGVIKFSLSSGIEITSRISSEVVSFFSTGKAFGNDEALGLLDDLEQSSSDPDTLWRVLGELIQSDDGYIRFDHDPERENGDLHPLNHLDIFYSQSATFKIGLRRKYKVVQMIDILDINSNCSFLEVK